MVLAVIKEPLSPESYSQSETIKIQISDHTLTLAQLSRTKIEVFGLLTHKEWSNLIKGYG